MVDADDKLIITPDEAESLLPEGDTIHNFACLPDVLIGCDFSRENAIEAFKSALMIEIAGPTMYGMGHALAVWKTKEDVSFFAADKAKVSAFEALRVEA